MKTAFLFPGQGAQLVGMGKDVYDAVPSAAALFDQANDLLGFDLKSICFEGPEDKLNTTVMSQPAIFVTSAALLEAMKEKVDNLPTPDVVAGLSMGEYTALYAAGLLDFESTLRLVAKRGQAMQEAADQSDGSMVSILGMDESQVQTLCNKASEGDLLSPANYNCPGQIVISGSKAACERAVTLAPDMGAMKAIPLAVAGAFHTDMMTPAATTLKAALSEASIGNPGQPQVIANVNCNYYQTADAIIEGLAQQLVSPILWQRCMEHLQADGIESFYEIGPGRVLTGLMRRIHRKTKVNNISSMQSIEALAS